MPVETIKNFYQAIIDRDEKAIMDHYDRADSTYVMLEGPGLSRREYKQIKRDWHDFIKSDVELESVEWMEGPYAEENRSTAWAAGVVRVRGKVKRKSFDQVFRASFVFRRKRRRWLIQHQHISAVLNDPYGDKRN